MRKTRPAGDELAIAAALSHLQGMAGYQGAVLIIAAGGDCIMRSSLQEPLVRRLVTEAATRMQGAANDSAAPLILKP